MLTTLIQLVDKADYHCQVHFQPKSDSICGEPPVFEKKYFQTQEKKALTKFKEDITKELLSNSDITLIDEPSCQKKN